MCILLYNKCSKAGCGKKEEISSCVKICKKGDAKNGRLCGDKPKEEDVSRELRQLCKTHNGYKKLSNPYAKKAPAPAKQRAASLTSVTPASDVGKSQVKASKATQAPPSTSTKNLLHKTTNNASSSTMTLTNNESSGKGKEKVQEPDPGPTSKPPASKLSTSMDSLEITDSSKDGDLAPKPPRISLRMPKNLPKEPSDWQRWRVTKPDSRDSRYKRAKEAHSKRNWPLPYESRKDYVKRQTSVLGRPKDDENHKPMQTEWLAWRVCEPDLYPSDDSGYQEFLDNQFKMAMAARGKSK